MNIKKFLVAGALVATTITMSGANVAGTCANGGFYGAFNVGVVFAKGSIKVDTELYNGNKYTDFAKKFAEGITKAQEAVKADVTQYSKDVDAAISAIADVIVKNAATMVQEADGTNAPDALGSGATLATLAASNSYLGNIVHSIVTNSPDAATITGLDDYAKTALDKLSVDAIKVVLAKATFASGVAGEYITKMNAVNTTAAITNGNAAIIIPGLTGVLASSTAKECFSGIITFADKASPTGVVPSVTADLTKIKADYATYVKALTALSEGAKASKVDVVKNLFANGTATLVPAAMTDGQEPSTLVGTTTKTDATPKANVADADTIKTAITSAITEAGKSDVEELGLTGKGVASKSATGFAAEIALGYDHRIGDCMIGIEMPIGINLGGKCKIKDKGSSAGSDGITVQQSYYVGLMPRVGYLVTPAFEIYATAGFNFGKYTADTTNMATVLDKSEAVEEIAKAWNETAKGTGYEISDADMETIGKLAGVDTDTFKKFHRTKFVPVIGLGVRYNITPDVFMKLEYNYAFRTKVVKQVKAGCDVRYQAQKLMLGIGCRF